jgi:hypothetical protein
MLPPRWLRLRVGPYLRREKDKRAYFLLFRGPGARGLAQRAACLLALPRRPEPSSLRAPPAGLGVYVFEGMGSCFAPLRGEHAVLRRELVAMLRARFVPRPLQPLALAVHVRRGDFTTPPTDVKLRGGHHNYQIPIRWYVDALRAVRSTIGTHAPTTVFSDGHADELRELLTEPQTTLHAPVSAATDLLTMSSAAGLVASGSSFSQWASFLGQVPTVWYPGQRRELVIDDDLGPSLEPEWESGALPEAFGAAVRRRLSPASING